MVLYKHSVYIAAQSKHYFDHTTVTQGRGSNALFNDTVNCFLLVSIFLFLRGN